MFSWQKSFAFFVIIILLLKECQRKIENLNATISCIFSLPREYVPPDGCVAGIIAALEKSGGLQRPEKTPAKKDVAGDIRRNGYEL